MALGLGFLGIVGWLAILARLREQAGDTRADAERKVLWSGALLVAGMLAIEALAAEVLAERFPPRRKLGFMSLGSSTTGCRASEDEEMLAEGFGR